MRSPWPSTVTPALMPADTAPLAVNVWLKAFELAVAPSVLVVFVVVVLAAQLTEFGLLVTSQAASAACGPASSIASAAVDSADEPSSVARAREPR
jgi:hypothetical protein